MTEYKSAAYLRLSREDGDKAESDSISNQRAIIQNYLEDKPELMPVKEYVDDGCTGIRFDRPGFIQMMEDIQARKIRCVIVKDLSRLGRNYIDMGRYLEKVFPENGVRFIAILNHYDNARPDSGAQEIIIPFTNLINDSYCRDISVKIRSHLDIKRKKGEFIGSFAAYGYQKDGKNKNRLVIDEYPAQIVQHIFRLRLSGYSAAKIAKKLDELGALTPMEYKRRRGMNYNCGFRAGENPTWSATSVRRILENEIYTGTMVQGKWRKINYKVRESRMIDKADWIRVEGTHEAIIPRPVFDAVQELAALDTRTSPEEERVYLFSGLLKCGSCGENMVQRTLRPKNASGACPYRYYHCSTYKRTGGCASHLINEKKVEMAVLKAVQTQACLLAGPGAILETAAQVPAKYSTLRLIDRQIAESEEQANRYRSLKAKLYQDMRKQTVSQDEYAEINLQFLRKLEAAEQAKSRLEKKRQEILTRRPSGQSQTENSRAADSPEGLNRGTVVRLIRRIIIHSRDNIEIQFRYRDEFGSILAHK